MLFFLTPIVYPVSMIPGAYKVYFDFNPLSALIELWRRVLLQGEFYSFDFFLSLCTVLIIGALDFVVYAKSAVKIGKLIKG